MILTEATAVTRDGRISPWDAGLWEDQQIVAWERVVSMVHRCGSLIGVQLGHAGRKASTYAPFHDRSGFVDPVDGGWVTMGPGSRAFGRLPEPRSMTKDEIASTVQAFAAAARRAVGAGFDSVEIHAAHGYLLAQFLSPLVNDRKDEYGGSLEGRARFLMEVISVVRGAVPDRIPVLLRLSATDWVPGSVEDDVAETVAVSQWAQQRGIDLVDVSSGGNVPAPEVPVGPGYQTDFAAQVRRSVGIPVSAVGMITEPDQAEHILGEVVADVVMMARAVLADPHWWHGAARSLGHQLPWIGPYARAATVLP